MLVVNSSFLVFTIFSATEKYAGFVDIKASSLGLYVTMSYDLNLSFL